MCMRDLRKSIVRAYVCRLIACACEGCSPIAIYCILLHGYKSHIFEGYINFTGHAWKNMAHGRLICTEQFIICMADEII